MTLRLGFIGTGIISQKHLQGIVELNQIIDSASDPAYEFVAVADPRRVALQALAAEAEKMAGTHQTVYDDCRFMLEKEVLGWVSILVSHHLHWSIAIDCVDAGVDIRMQKPVAISIADGHQIVNLDALCLRFCLSDPRVASAIVDMRRISEVESNLYTSESDHLLDLNFLHQRRVL